MMTGNCFNTAERSWIGFVAAMRHRRYKAIAGTRFPQLRRARTTRVSLSYAGPEKQSPERPPAPAAAARRQPPRQGRWAAREGRQMRERGDPWKHRRATGQGGSAYSSSAFRSVTQPYTSRCAAVSGASTAMNATAMVRYPVSSPTASTATRSGRVISPTARVAPSPCARATT